MKRQIKLLSLEICLMILFEIIYAKYIPDPLYLSHGRGMEAGDNGIPYILFLMNMIL